MISADNKNMQEAGETLFTLNGNDRIRDLCEAREDYRRTWGGVKMSIAELQMEVTELKSANEEKDTAITKLKSSNTELESSINQKDSLIASLEARIVALQQQLSESSINSP